MGRHAKGYTPVLDPAIAYLTLAVALHRLAQEAPMRDEVKV